MHDGLLVDVLYGGQDALRKLLFGSDLDVSEHGARQLGEEALNEIEPGTMLGGESKFEAAFGLGSEPGFGFLRSVG
jgi:hypothetical protein